MYSVFNTTEADVFKPPELTEAILAKMTEMREKYLTGPDGPIMTPKPIVVPRGPLQHVYVPPTMASVNSASSSRANSTVAYTHSSNGTSYGSHSETKKTYAAVEMPGISMPSLTTPLPSKAYTLAPMNQTPLHVPSHMPGTTSATSMTRPQQAYLPAPMPGINSIINKTSTDKVYTITAHGGTGAECPQKYEIVQTNTFIAGQGREERKYAVSDMPSSNSGAGGKQYQVASMPSNSTGANMMMDTSSSTNRGTKRSASEMSNLALTSTGNGQDPETVGKLDDVACPKDYARATVTEEWPQLSVVTINGIRVAGYMRVMDHRFFKYTMSLTDNVAKRPRLDPKATNSWLMTLLNETKYWITKVRHAAVTMSEDAGIASYALAMHEFANDHTAKFDKAMTSLSEYIATTPILDLNMVSWLDAERRKGIENEWAHELLSSEVLASYFTCCDLAGDTAILLDYLPLHAIREMNFDERRVRRASMKANPYSIFFPLMHLRTASFTDWLDGHARQGHAQQGRAAPVTHATSIDKEFKTKQKSQGKDEKDSSMNLGHDTDKYVRKEKDTKEKEEEEEEQDLYDKQKNEMNDRFVIPVTLPRSSLSDLVNLHGSSITAAEYIKFLDLDQFFRAATYEMIDMDQKAGGDTSSEIITNSIMVKFRRKGAWQKAMSECNDLYQEAFLADRDNCKMGSFTGQTLSLRMHGYIADLSPFIMALIKERHLVLHQDETKTHGQGSRASMQGLQGQHAPVAPLFVMVRSAFVFAAEVKTIMKNFLNKASRAYPQLKGVLFDPKYFVETDENKDTPDIALARAQYSMLDADQKRLHSAITWNHPIIVVTGGAGTGKTWTVMRFLIGEREEKGPWTSDEERLDENGDVIPKPPAWTKKSTVLVLTPTNRIARRIQRLFGLDASTFHNLLTWGLFNDLVDRLDHVRVLVLEELGLVGERLFNMVMRLVPFMNSLERIICSGDHMQLKSVDPGNVIEDLRHCPWIKQCELTEDHRSDPDSRILAEVCRCIAHKDIMGLPRRAAAFTVGTYNVNTTYRDLYAKFGAPRDVTHGGATVPDPTQFQILSFSHNAAREANLGFLTAAGKLSPSAAASGSGSSTISSLSSISSNTNKYARAASYPAFFYVGEKLGVTGREDRDGVRFDTNQTLVVRRIYDVWPKLEDIQMDCQQTNVPMHSYLGEVASTRMLDLYDPEADETYSVHMSADMCRKMIPGWCQVLHAWQGDQAKHIAYILESYATRRHLYTGVSRAQKSVHVISKTALFPEQVWNEMVAIILRPEEPVLTALRTVLGA